jgi:hypothetical protein
MGFGAYSVFTRALASGTTAYTTGVDLGRAWASIKLDIPARSNTTVYLQSSADNSTYRRVFAEGNATTVPVLFQLPSATTSVIVPLPGGHRYVKVETQDSVADGATFKFICSDY